MVKGPQTRAVELHSFDDDDDSYNADWSPPGMEQAPPSSRPTPMLEPQTIPPRSMDTISIGSSKNSAPPFDRKSNNNGYSQSSKYNQGYSNSYGQTHQSTNTVSFSLDNVAESSVATADGYSNRYQRPPYPNSNYRESSVVKGKDYYDDDDYDDGDRRSSTKGTKGGRYQAPLVDNKKHRVRPYRCFTEPTYMTEDEIYEDMMKPSTTSAFLKSHFPPSTSKIPGELKLSDAVRNLYDSPEVDGRIGSIRVEVLGCVGLARQKPYCAVYVISGDCAFCTDVLNNFRSPMWPCASTRCAVFPVHHAYARVYIGLFDVRKRQNKDNDVFLGRAVIDIAQLRPNTEYDVTFPLRASSFVYDRRKRGVIRVRFSLHWFSERAAICSYLKSSRWFSQSEPTKGLGQPTIPCAEPKTFRNIAVTCHGQDFPGKYTRMAFRATMREFNLYHMNIRFVFKTLTLDALLYERPHISLYLFLAFQHCIYSNVVRMVPPYFTGYIILLFLDNYVHFNVSEKFNLGYKPLTVKEILMGVLKDGKSNKPNFEALDVKKRAKKRGKSKGRIGQTEENSFFSNWRVLAGLTAPEEALDEGVEIEPRDHREFPFSERDEYPKFAVQEALAPSTKAPVKGEEGNTRMAGRLSIYFVKEEGKGIADDDVNDEDEEESDEDEESDDEDDEEDDDDDQEENIEIAADSGGDVDVYDMEYEPEEEEVRQTGGGTGLFDMGSSKLKRARVRVGPPQNCDISSKKKTPPQQNLQKIEKQLHKLSRGIALERVITVPGARKYGPEPGEDDKGKKKGKTSKEDVLAKKSHYDEFDKVLGLQSKTANPVLRITSSFLGPLMRMMRVFLYVTRIIFNLSTWRDPYFSFWILSFLVTLMIILLVFPWRPFLFITSFLSLGPQNVFVRKYLEKKAAEKAMEKAQMAQKEANEIEFDPVVNESKIEQAEFVVSTVENKEEEVVEVEPSAVQAASAPASVKTPLPVSSGNKSKNKGLLGKSMKKGKKSESIVEDLFSFDTDTDNVEQRPAFSTGHNSRVSKKIRPREVAVPYSKLRKDRFYDWPPDPTVSRATPVPGPWLSSSLSDVDGHANGSKSGMDGYGGPTAQSIPSSNGLPSDLEGLRRRYVSEQQQFKVGSAVRNSSDGMSPW